MQIIKKLYKMIGKIYKNNKNNNYNKLHLHKSKIKHFDQILSLYQVNHYF